MKIFPLLLSLLFCVSPLTAKDYIDVHVHLRGTTSSGILGNQRNQRRIQPRPLSQRPFGPGQSQRLQGGPHNTIPPQSRNLDNSNNTEENLRKAARLMIRKMDERGVEKALVVVVPGKLSAEKEYQSLHSVVSQFPERLALLAGGAQLAPYLQKIDPDKVDSKDIKQFRKLAESILDDGAVGFGEMIAYHLSMADHHSFQYAPADHPLYLLLADIAAERDVAIDLHMEAITDKRPMPDNLKRASSSNPKTLEPTIPAFERLLTHNRNARIVWQHIGWDNTGDMTPALVSRLLDSHPNLYIALRVENRIQQVGDGDPMPNRLVDVNDRIQSDWLKLIKRFPERITIGSDEFFFPVDSERPNQSFKQSWSLLDQLPSDIAIQIGTRNPRRIYNL